MCYRCAALHHLYKAAIFVVCDVYCATYDNLVFELSALDVVVDVDVREATLGNQGGCCELALDSDFENAYRRYMFFEHNDDCVCCTVGNSIQK